MIYKTNLKKILDCLKPDIKLLKDLSDTLEKLLNQ